MIYIRTFLRGAALIGVGAALSGCAAGFGVLDPHPGGHSDAPSAPVRATPPSDAVAAITPPAGARTAETFDTTTSAERAAAANVPPAARPERELGRTVASLGDPGTPGFWAKTALVTSVQAGRLMDPVTGNSVLVELRPLGVAGGGSQVSLPALRILGVPLTALPELIVYARP